MSDVLLHESTPNQGKERERRYIVKSIDELHIFERFDQIRIKQGFTIGSSEGQICRVRISQNNKKEGEIKAMLCKKTGKGEERDETEQPLNDIEAAKFMLKHFCHYTMEKIRYRHKGLPRWAFDRITTGPLAGLWIAEYEIPKDEPSLPPKLPYVFESWADLVDVTETITNFTLAVISQDLQQYNNDSLLRKLISNRVEVIGITGAPGSGKSEAIKQLIKDSSGKLIAVREMATLLITETNILPPSERDDLRNANFQRTLYRMQCAIEDATKLFALATGQTTIIADRTTFDLEAYHLGDKASFYQMLGTTPTTENSRYKKIIAITLPPKPIWELIKDNNPARRETYQEAIELEGRTLAASAGHPNFIIINENESWEKKYEKIKKEVLG